MYPGRVVQELSIHCPFCHQHTNVSPAIVDVAKFRMSLPNPVPAAYFDGYGRTWWIAVCNNRDCRMPMLVNNHGTVIPTPQPPASDERIPDHVRRDLDEAKRCATVGAWRGCATMARRALQAGCLLKGADEGKKLQQQIDQLHTLGVITKELKEWAHEVRFLGNDGAHPPKDFANDVVSEDDADDALDLTEEFLEVVFVTPARAAARKAKRTSTP